MNVEQAFKIADTLVFNQKQRHLKDIEVAILKGAFQGETYSDIAANYGCTAEYIKHDIGPKFWKLLSESLSEKVSKKNFRSALERQYNNWQSKLQSKLNALDKISSLSINDSSTTGFKYGETICDRDFIGREAELASLKHYLLESDRRLVAISGAAGIGKTVLAAHLLEEICDKYQGFFWISLLNYSSFSGWTDELNSFIKTYANTSLNANKQFHKFNCSNCLLVIDNLETANNIEMSLKFIDKLIAYNLNITVIIITRNSIKPISNSILSLELTGLSDRETYLLLQNRGFSVSLMESSYLCDRYRGNPLALKLLAATVDSCQNVPNSSDIWRGFAAIFVKIEDILEHQFECLSSLEKQIIYCLVTATNSLEYKEILDRIITPISQIKLGEMLNLLLKRALIEKAIALDEANSSIKYTLQPLIEEYMSGRFNLPLPQTAKNFWITS